jgi:ABC-2 type transport system ATP-binding protein
MHRGKLVAAGTVGEITAGAESETTFLVDSPQDAVTVLNRISGVSGVDVEGEKVHADLNGLSRSDALAALVRAGVGVRQAGPRRRLEDAFLQLVGEEVSG